MPTGELIKKIRKQKKMTQKQLGEKCGIADSNIRKYENGKQFPKWETLERIAKALGVDVFDLIEYAEGPDEEDLDYTSPELDLLINFRNLNSKGQNKALEQIEMLTKIPEYRKDKE